MIETLDDLIPRFYSDRSQINWREVSSKQLSINFISMYQDKLDWKMLSMRYRIDDNFLEKFKNKIIWSDIIFNPKFDYNYIIQYINKLTVNDLENYIRFNLNRIDKLSELRLIREMIN